MNVKQRSKPRYAELGDLLRAGIERGDYPVGSLLPTELELCERHEVSRHTARAALAQLMQAGLVSRRPGAGTKVIAQHEAMRYQHSIDTVDMLIQYGNETRLKVLSVQRLVADQPIATRLEIASGKEYLHLIALRLEEPTREPIAITEMFIPVRKGVPVEKLLDQTTASRTVAHFLEPTHLSCVEQVFDAASFSTRDAQLLGIKRSEPAMRVQRRYRNSNNHLLVLAVSLHPPGRFAYSMVLSRGSR
ncbi:MAG: GntR family transcriptional regulator [Rhodanobacter sp.]